jgi:bacillithiol biosynthesis deacetylase BshB1
MSQLDILAIGAHPDDVELGCGGTLALAARQGRRVGILHLTRGERGSRGTAEERLAEAERAAAALGAVELAFLDCGDGALRHAEAEEDALIEVLRTWRPELVLGPPRHDRHPDHGRAHELVAAAAFYSGLAARGSRAAGAPHRPAAVFSYMQHHGFEPSFVVDVTATWEIKLAALAAYRSQLYQASGGGPASAAAMAAAAGAAAAASGVAPPAAPAATFAASAASGASTSGGVAHPGAAPPLTKVASREFRLAVEGRARHFGQLIGAELGEPFWSPLPLAVSDLSALAPRGLR